MLQFDGQYGPVRVDPDEVGAVVTEIVGGRLILVICLRSGSEIVLAEATDNIEDVERQIDAEPEVPNVD